MYLGTLWIVFTIFIIITKNTQCKIINCHIPLYYDIILPYKCINNDKWEIDLFYKMSLIVCELPMWILFAMLNRPSGMVNIALSMVD